MPATVDRVPRHFDAALGSERRALLTTAEGAAAPVERERFVTLLLARLMFARFLAQAGFGVPFAAQTLDSGLALPEAALKRLSAFFDRYRWRIDDRAPAAADEITP